LGRYHIIGRLCFVFIHLAAGSTTTYGSGNYSFALPYAARNATQNYYGVAHLRDTGVANYELRAAILAGGSTISLFIAIDPAGNNVSNWTPTVPFTFGSGATMQIQIAYELSGT
jgi:hypothetical protein